MSDKRLEEMTAAELLEAACQTYWSVEDTQRHSTLISERNKARAEVLRLMELGRLNAGASTGQGLRWHMQLIADLPITKNGQDIPNAAAVLQQMAKNALAEPAAATTPGQPSGLCEYCKGCADDGCVCPCHSAQPTPDVEQVAREEAEEIAEASRRKNVFLRGKRMSIFERVTLKAFAKERRNSSSYMALYSMSELQDEINREGTLDAIKINLSLRQLRDFLKSSYAILAPYLSGEGPPSTRCDSCTPEYTNGNTYCKVCKQWLHAGPSPHGAAPEPSSPESAPESVKLVGNRMPTAEEIKYGESLQPEAEAALQRNKERRNSAPDSARELDGSISVLNDLGD